MEVITFTDIIIVQLASLLIGAVFENSVIMLTSVVQSLNKRYNGEAFIFVRRKKVLEA